MQQLQSLQTTLRQRYHQLQATENDQERAKVADSLRATLGELFDLQIDVQQQTVAQLETRVNKLRDQVSQRRGKRDEVIDLQIRVWQHQAEGLGFGAPGPNFWDFTPDHMSGSIQLFGQELPNSAAFFGLQAPAPPGPGPSPPGAQNPLAPTAPPK
jgi:hypothetical protein